MPATRRKVSVSARTKKEAHAPKVGPDGRTANDRFREAFNTWSGGQRTQMELVRICDQIAGRPPNAEKHYVSQQIIDQIIRNEINAARSMFLDVLAEALGVRAVWLRLGVGDSKPDRALLERVREVLKTAP